MKFESRSGILAVWKHVEPHYMCMVVFFFQLRALSEQKREPSQQAWTGEMACKYLCLKLRELKDKHSYTPGMKNWPTLAKHNPSVTELLVSTLGHEVSHIPHAHQLAHLSKKPKACAQTTVEERAGSTA